MVVGGYIIFFLYIFSDFHVQYNLFDIWTKD